MEKIGSWFGSAKQLAQNAIKDKLESGSAASGQILLNVLHDAFMELPEQRRMELFQVMDTLLAQYKAEAKFDFEPVWEQAIRHSVIQDLASSVSKNLIKSLISKARL